MNYKYILNNNFHYKMRFNEFIKKIVKISKEMCINLENKDLKTKLKSNDEKLFDQKIKDFEKLKKILPLSNSQFPNTKIVTFPIYAIFVAIAMLLTLNYSPSNKLLARIKKLEWYQMIQQIINTNNGIALTVYPNEGLLISFSENKFEKFNQHKSLSEFNSESFYVNNDKYSFVPFPSQNYFSQFLDYILKQTNLVYEQLDIVYRYFINLLIFILVLFLLKIIGLLLQFLYFILCFLFLNFLH